MNGNEIGLKVICSQSEPEIGNAIACCGGKQNLLESSERDMERQRGEDCQEKERRDIMKVGDTKEAFMNSVLNNIHHNTI